jgi:hypothetical protein
LKEIQEATLKQQIIWSYAGQNGDCSEAPK